MQRGRNAYMRARRTELVADVPENLSYEERMKWMWTEARARFVLLPQAEQVLLLPDADRLPASDQGMSTDMLAEVSRSFRDHVPAGLTPDARLLWHKWAARQFWLSMLSAGERVVLLESFSKGDDIQDFILHTVKPGDFSAWPGLHAAGVPHAKTAEAPAKAKAGKDYAKVDPCPAKPAAAVTHPKDAAYAAKPAAVASAKVAKPIAAKIPATSEGTSACDGASVDLPIERLWFDLINQGVKKIEFRKVCPFWTSRLTKKAVKKVRLVNGHFWTPETPYSIFTVLGITKMAVTAIPPGWGPPPGSAEHAKLFGIISEVYAIELGEQIKTFDPLPSSEDAAGELAKATGGCAPTTITRNHQESQGITQAYEAAAARKLGKRRRVRQHFEERKAEFISPAAATAPAAAAAPSTAAAVG